MFWNLLAETAEEGAKQGGNSLGSLILIVALVAIIVVFMVLNSRSAKKRQQETQDMLNAIRPGHKVKTIGGICGVVVEVDEEENTFVLETGTEKSGKSYIKFDKQAVYQTDAVAEKPEKASKSKKGENAEETTETVETAETVEETPVDAPAETEEVKTEEEK